MAAKNALDAAKVFTLMKKSSLPEVHGTNVGVLPAKTVISLWIQIQLENEKMVSYLSILPC